MLSLTLERLGKGIDSVGARRFLEGVGDEEYDMIGYSL